MKTINFVIFYSIVLLVNGGINYYIIRRGLQVLPLDSKFRLIFVLAVIFLASAFIVGRVLESQSINVFTDMLIWIGSFWMAFMVYFLLSLVFIDLLRVLNYFFGIFPDFISNNTLLVKQLTAAVVIVTTTIAIIVGHINIHYPVVKSLELEVDKSGGKLKELKIVAASDIHLGTIIGKARMSKIADIINSLEPDIILLPGDIIDEDIQPVLKDNMGESLEKLKAKYGVYAVTGNHEYIGGVEPAVAFMEKHKINILRDEAVLIDSSFYVAGREDLSISTFTNRKRKTLEKVLEKTDSTHPIILMDHQPFKLENAEKAGVDLQLSGHTHHGQLWPFNYITKMVYELSWGYKKKSNTHFYVSCGIGGWGPPIRTNSRPEIINIKLKFKN